MIEFRLFVPSFTKRKRDMGLGYPLVVTVRCTCPGAEFHEHCRHEAAAVQIIEDMLPPLMSRAADGADVKRKAGGDEHGKD